LVPLPEATGFPDASEDQYEVKVHPLTLRKKDQSLCMYFSEEINHWWTGQGSTITRKQHEKWVAQGLGS